MKAKRPIVPRDDHFICAKDAARMIGVGVKIIYRAMDVFARTHGRQGLQYSILLKRRLTCPMWVNDYCKQKEQEVLNGCY